MRGWSGFMAVFPFKIALTGAIFFAGFGAGWYVYRPIALPAEKHAAAVVQADGSTVLERVPSAPVNTPELPKGATVTRQTSVTVKPKQPDCEPVTVEITTIKTDDGQRAIAKTDSGTIIGGVDIPVTFDFAPKQHKWAVGAVYTSDKKYGIFIDRDLGFVRLGVSVNQTAHGTLSGQLRAGIVF